MGSTVRDLRADTQQDRPGSNVNYCSVFFYTSKRSHVSYVIRVKSPVFFCTVQKYDDLREVLFKIQQNPESLAR